MNQPLEDFLKDCFCTHSSVLQYLQGNFLKLEEFLKNPTEDFREIFPSIICSNHHFPEEISSGAPVEWSAVLVEIAKDLVELLKESLEKFQALFLKVLQRKSQESINRIEYDRRTSEAMLRRAFGVADVGELEEWKKRRKA